MNPTFVARLARIAPVVALCMFVLCACASDDKTAPEENDDNLGTVALALSGLPTSTPLGNMSFAVGTSETKNDVGVWHDVNRLATGVWSRGGEALQITVSGEVAGTGGSLFLRAFVDDTLALPSDVQFFVSGSEKKGARSFTFVAPPSSVDGFHLVRIQWLSTSEFKMTDRTLVVRAVPVKSGYQAQMSWVVAPSDKPVYIKAGDWQEAPNLATNISLRETMDLQITFAAETFTNRKRFMARALLDGEPTAPKDVTIEQEDRLAQGTRSMTFTARDVKPGTHNVRIQIMTDLGGDIAMGDRTLTVVGSVRRTKEGGMDNRTRETSPVKISNEWKPLMAGAVDIGVTSSAAIVSTVSLEHSIAGKGALHMRVSFNGEVAEPADVTLDRNSSLNTQSFSFGRRDFKRDGLIEVKLEFRTDEKGTLAEVRDVSLATTAVRRTGADFAQAQPFENMTVPRQSAVPLLTICFDPERPGHPRLTNAILNNVVDGADGMENARDLFAEMSARRFMIAQHMILGCGEPSFYHPPPEHMGTWYWDDPPDAIDEKRFDIMRREALERAAQDFDFAQYDVDHDGAIEAHELAVMVCLPQQSVAGSARGGTYNLGGHTLSVPSIDCYIPGAPDAGARRPAVGLISHELAHVLLTTRDFYGYADDGIDEMPGALSLMGTGAAIHLDAYHKMHSGWIGPTLINLDTWTTREISLDAIESSREAIIIYNPKRNNREFFMLENRYNGTDLPFMFNYDQIMNPAFAPSTVVWHIVEDFNDLDPTVPPPSAADPTLWPDRLAEYGWRAGGVQRMGQLTPDKQIDLYWADGTPAGMTAVGVTVGKTATIKLKKWFVNEEGELDPDP